MEVGIERQCNYIADEQLMAWLAVRQENLFADLEQAMDLSEERHQMVSDLTEIKQHLTESHRAKNFNEVNAELKTFLERYGNNPTYTGVCDEIRKIADPIDKNWTMPDPPPPPTVVVRLEEFGDSSSVVEEVIAYEPPHSSFSDKTIDTWCGTIDGKVDELNQNDQIGMVHVQQLKSNIDQSAQMASALICGSDRTLESILNNLG